LTEAEQAAVATHGLYDLSTFLPKKPGAVELKVIKEMFEASVDGQPYDTERWGQYFRPAGVNAPAGTAAEDTPAPVARSAPAPVANFDEEVDAAEKSFAAEPVAAPKPAQKAEDILAMIRSRQQK
jgi:hypothetical protein